MPAISANTPVDVTGGAFELPEGTRYLEITVEPSGTVEVPHIVMVQNDSYKGYEVVPCILAVEGAGLTDWQVTGVSSPSPKSYVVIAWTSNRPWGRVNPFVNVLQTTLPNSSIPGS